MYQIDNSTAAATQPASTAAGTAGFFTDGNAATGVAATVLPAEFMNALMLETLNVITAAGITPSKSSFTQLRDAIKGLSQAQVQAYAVQQGGGIGQSSNKLYLGLGGSRIKVTVDQTDFGNVVFDGNIATEAVVGVLKVATQGMVNAGTNDDSAITPKKLRNGFAYGVGENGYIALPSWLGGLIFQWGTTSIPGSNTSSQVTLPIQYTTSHMFAMASDSGSSAYPAGAYYTSLSQVAVYCAPYVGNSGSLTAKNTTAAIRWFSIGY